VCARTFEFVGYGEEYTGSSPSICADGLVKGASLQLTHWSGNETPAEYKADLSTEIAFRWLKLLDSNPKQQAHYENAVVLNNHCDTDGIMSIWALLNPEKALDYEDIMVKAAAAGDFSEWALTSDRGMQLDIAFTKLIDKAGNDKDAYDQILPQVEELLTTISRRKDLWEEEMAELDSQLDAVLDGHIKTSRLQDNASKFSHASGKIGDMAVLVHPLGFDQVKAPVVTKCFPHYFGIGDGKGVTRLLLAMEQEGGGYMYVYERPAYAWADTVSRPAIKKPNVDAILGSLGPKWTGEDVGMTGLCKTTTPIMTTPDEMSNELLSIERGLLPRLR